MSETRTPDEIFLHRLPENNGKKSGKNCIKYELFQAKQWALDWCPCDRKFFPRPSLESIARKKYWEQMYRLRINGKWHGQEAKYRFYTREEIGKMLMGERLC